MSNHPIVHIEFPSRNLEESASFYSEAFGWKTQSVPEFNYAMFDAVGGPGGGFNPLGEVASKPGDVFVYIQTEDIEETLAKIESLGGKTVQSKTEIPGMGWFAFFTDPTGNRVGLYTGMNQ